MCAARTEGVGRNYLIEHSAGSGKSTTSGWLTHRSVVLHDAAHRRGTQFQLERADVRGVLLIEARLFAVLHEESPR